MNLLRTEVLELRQMLSNFKDGTLDAKDLDIMLGVYGQTEKRMRITLQAIAAAQRLGITEIDIDILNEMVGKGDVRPELENRTASRGK